MPAESSGEVMRREASAEVMPPSVGRKAGEDHARMRKSDSFERYWFSATERSSVSSFMMQVLKAETKAAFLPARSGII